MHNLMQRRKRQKNGNFNLKLKQGRHIENVFFKLCRSECTKNCVPWFTNSINKMYKYTVFINTSLLENRTFLLKPKSMLGGWGGGGEGGGRCFSCVCSVCACLDLSVSSSSWGLGRAAVCDCGTPWTFLLPFLINYHLIQQI